MLATWGCTTFPKPTLDLELAGATSLDSRITFTRGSQATLFDSAGTLVFAPNNVIRNNTMVGAVAGTPGTLPTNWSVAAGGLAFNVISTGIESGINYIDIQVVGTTTSSSSGIRFEPTNFISATSGQNWNGSFYIRAVSGSTANLLQTVVNLAGRTSGNAATTDNSSSANFLSSLSATNIANNRKNNSITLADATTAFVFVQLLFTHSIGAAIDITLRIGMPQLERGSVATAVNATSGTAYYGPRFDYDPSTLAARGLLIEEARTNSIRNNTMQGAVAGTPGTAPANWSVAAAAGLTTNVIGTGTSNGITYIDLQITGTTSATSYILVPEAATQIAAQNGQTWAMSAWWSIVNGDLTNVTAAFFDIRELDSGGVQLTSGQVIVAAPTATFTRITATRTLNQATTAFVQPRFRFTVTNATAVNFTLRIGLPQLELGAFATSVIPTTTTALTRNADVASMTGTNFSSWYNAVAGTFFAAGGVVENGGSILSVHDGSTSNSIAHIFRFSNSSRTWTFASSVEQTNITNSVSGNVKHAFAYATNDFAQSVNGLAAVTDTSASVPTVTQLSIGTRVTGNYLNGHIQRISFWPIRLANSQLQALTA